MGLIEYTDITINNTFARPISYQYELCFAFANVFPIQSLGLSSELWDWGLRL
jgi:hypothetical protein